MKHLLKLSLILLAFLLPATAAASPITLQQAQQNALSFLESKGKSISSSSLRQAQLRSTSTANETYYVFNIGSNEGYVIASGDDCAPAILGYAESGYIDIDSMPANMKEWLEEYAQQIQFMQKNGYSSYSHKFTSSNAAIDPLMTTTWDQLDPYNQNCPDFFSYGKCVTGCVATAMAQIMYYHRARSVTQTTAQIPAYTCRHRWISGSDTLQIHVDAVPAGSPIDWENMLDSYDSNASTVQQQAVANLMKYCGAAVQMDYANEWNGGSGAYSSDVPTALKTYFNYSSETVLKNRSSYSSDEEWENLIYNELSNSRPVYYSGRNSSGGHAFVCDGYDGSGYYHINWGWSGTSDGFFLLTALDPNEQGAGGSSSGYNQNQAAVIYAEPNSTTPSNPVLATSISLNKTNAELNTGETLQLTATVLPNNTTNKTISWTTSNSSIATVSSSGLVTAKAVGNATITARTTDGTNLSATCSVTVKQGTVLATSITLNKTSAQVSIGGTTQLTATVLPSNATNKTVTWTTSNSSVATVSSNGLVTAKATGTATITAKTTDGSNLSAACAITVTSQDSPQGSIITFADANVKAICVQNWDTNGDGELSFDEAEAVTTLGSFFRNKSITSFDELRYFTGLTSINSQAFSSCSRLTAITIPSSVTTIEYAAFKGCSGLTSITIPSSVTSIEWRSFGNCTGLESITIPSSVTNIGVGSLGGGLSGGPFDSCSNLTSITVNANNTVYDSRNNCNAIIRKSDNKLIVGCKNTVIPSNVTSIGGAAFKGCSGLMSITIPSSVTSIGTSAFYACSNLSSIMIPSNVTSISSDAFNSCINLASITVNVNNLVYDSRNNCNAIIRTSDNRLIAGCKNTIIPSDVTSIADDAFQGCSGLTSITIPNAVTSIGSMAFYGCSGLTSIAIPSNVTNIGNYAFSSCSRLKEVYSLISDPSLVTMPSLNAFSDYYSSANRTLYVPKGSFEAYQSDSKWSQYFDTIVEMVFTTSIKLNHSSSILTKGENLQLIASILPLDAANKSLNWISSDTTIVTVTDSGLITAHSVGNATITATTTDGSNLSATCVVAVIEDVSNYDNYLSINGTETIHGETIVIPVKMTNEADIISFQTDIFLPEGLELMQENGEYIINPSSRMTRTHSIMSNDVSNGAVRVICYSSNYKPFTGNSGDDLFYITVKVADNADGDYIIQLKNTLLTNTDFVDIAAPDVAANVNVKSYLLGDANNSGTVTVTDVVVTAQYVLEQNPQPFVFEAADVNADGNITVADVSRIAWMVLNPSLNVPLRAPALWNNGDRMNGSDITLVPGETRRVSIMLDNEMDYAAFQLDLNLPEGLTASNFQLTDRAGSHAFDVNSLQNGNVRALCYSPAMEGIYGHEGALLTFDVTATGDVQGDINVDGIELVTADCQSVKLDAFTIGVNNESSISESISGKAIDKVEYFNLAGQRMEQPSAGVTLIVTTYTDGSRTTSKVIK